MEISTVDFVAKLQFNLLAFVRLGLGDEDKLSKLYASMRGKKLSLKTLELFEGVDK